MGIFGKKKEEDKNDSAVKATDVKKEAQKVEETPDKVNAKGREGALGQEETKPQKVSLESNAAVIKRPRITEKAALLSEKGVYVFEVRQGANKHEVKNAIKSIYNVTPVKVNIVNRQPRHAMSRSKGRSVMTHGLRKAYVYLKEGDRIELV